MRYIHKTAFLLAVLATAVLAGCENSKTLDDKGIAEYLNKCYGGEYKITQKENIPGKNEYNSIDLYSIEASDGTEFSLKKEWIHDYIGGHYKYADDYLVQWVYYRPELYSELDDTELKWEKTDDGFTILTSGFDEIAPAAVLACNIVNRCGGVLPNVGYSDEKVVFSHTVPGIHINGAERNAGTGLYDGTVEYLPEGSSESYDSGEVTFFFEQAYVDNVRDKKISEELSDEVLNRYPPKELEMDSECLYGEKLDRLDADDEIPETVYWISDHCKVNIKADSEYSEIPPKLERIETWAHAARYKLESSGIGYYTLSDSKNEVTFRFSTTEECYVEKNGERVGLCGRVYYHRPDGKFGSESYIAALTTEDLEKLFDMEFEFDYIKGTATVKCNNIE